MRIRGAVAISVVVLAASGCRSSRDYLAEADRLYLDVNSHLLATSDLQQM